MKRSTVRMAVALALLAGCGSSDTSSYESEHCFIENVACGRTHCVTRETCDSLYCKITEGYEDDLDYFYKTKCTDTVTVTTVEAPIGGSGIRTTTVRQSITECYYKEEIDEDDYEVTDNCTESSDTQVTREICERDPDCASCEPTCTPRDTAARAEGPGRLQ